MGGRGAAPSAGGARGAHPAGGTGPQTRRSRPRGPGRKRPRERRPPPRLGSREALRRISGPGLVQALHGKVGAGVYPYLSNPEAVQGRLTGEKLTSGWTANLPECSSAARMYLHRWPVRRRAYWVIRSTAPPQWGALRLPAGDAPWGACTRRSPGGGNGRAGRPGGGWTGL